MHHFDLEKLTDMWNARREERAQKILDFYAGKRSWLILQRPAYHVFGQCNSVEEIVANNLRQMETWLEARWTDELPHLEPWIGTGVYANAFGCEYLWRQGEAPDVRARFTSIEQVRGIDRPPWRSSPVMRMVLEAIDALKERTKARFPISSTDPQSPYDTATLVMDTSEFFTACYTDPETVQSFVSTITDLFVEFTHVQWERIGEGLVARPGHSIPSDTRLSGITLSDDNLAVASPLINERVSLPADRRLSIQFGGLFLHSCGTWHHTMRASVTQGGATGICCALQRATDPTPNDPARVGDALSGTGIMVHARFGPDLEPLLADLPKVARPGVRVMVDVLRTELDDSAWQARAEESYKRVEDRLHEIYGS
jgi:hypothetical protein